MSTTTNNISIKALFGAEAVAKALLKDRPFMTCGLPFVPGLKKDNGHYKRACEIYDSLVYDPMVKNPTGLYEEYLKMCAADGVDLGRAMACLADTASVRARKVKKNSNFISIPDVDKWIVSVITNDLTNASAKPVENKKAESAAATKAVPATDVAVVNTNKPVDENPELNKAKKSTNNDHQKNAGTHESKEAAKTEEPPKAEEANETKEAKESTNSDTAPKAEEPKKNNEVKETPKGNGTDGKTAVKSTAPNFNAGVSVNDDAAKKSAAKSVEFFDINNFIGGNAVFSNEPSAKPASDSQATPSDTTMYQLDPMFVAMLQGQRPGYFAPQVAPMHQMNSQPVQQPTVVQQPVASSVQTETACGCGDPNCTGNHMPINAVNEEEAKNHSFAEIPKSAPMITDEQKAQYVRKHIEFMEGAHCGKNAVTSTQLDNLYSMIKSSQLKAYLKKFKSKTRASNPHLYEVPMSKYAEPGDDDLYDICFECPCEDINGNKAKIVIKFSMTPQWNPTTKCYGSNLTGYRVESKRGEDSKPKANSSKKNDVEFKADSKK